MWVTEADFKALTDLSEFTDTQLKSILDSGKQRIGRRIVIPQRYTSSTVKTTHVITQDAITLDEKGYYISDYYSYDGEINKVTSGTTAWEVYAYEYDKNTYTEYPINSYITSFNAKYGVVTFSSAYPTNGRELRIEYYLSSIKWEDCYDIIRHLQLLWAIQSIIMIKPAAAQSVMSGSWTLNGVSIDAGVGSLEGLHKALDLQINSDLNELTPMILISRDIRRNDDTWYWNKY